MSEITADKLNRILAEIKRNRPVVAAPLSARVTGDGTHISIKSPPGGSSTTTRQPWDLIARVDPEADPEDENPPHKLRVAPGLFNNLLAPEWNDEWDAPYNSVSYAKIEVNTDGQTINSIKIVINTTAPVVHKPLQDGLETKIDILFGLFFKGSVFNTLTGHIVWNPKLWFVTSKQNAPVGQPPYDFWWKLVGSGTAF